MKKENHGLFQESAIAQIESHFHLGLTHVAHESKIVAEGHYWQKHLMQRPLLDRMQRLPLLHKPRQITYD